jgi:hypothetical protein
MHAFLIFLEVLWLFYYASVNIAAYALTDNSLLARAVRQDVFALGTHIAIVLVTIHGKCGVPWLILLYLFELFRDVLNAVNIQIYTPLQAYNHDLWIAVAVLGWFQVGTTILGMCHCLMQFKGFETRKTVKVPQFIYK